MTADMLAEARRLGEVGGPVSEEERALFEAWMAGHCWALSARWTGTQYLSDEETTGNVSMQAIVTRRLWAAWRDRAALAQTDTSALWAELAQQEQLLAVAVHDCTQLQMELDAKPQAPFVQYGQCETCGVFSDSAKALHDARRNCGKQGGDKP